ncbi:hypothetical protein BDW75DRAFT_238727 [Aspergillus navahoensis]
MHNDDAIQLGKWDLSRNEEHSRACAANTNHTNHESLEKDKPTEPSTEAYDLDPDSGPPWLLRGQRRRRGNEEAFSDDEGFCLDATYSYFEWGVDEPEFEGNPAFSDDEEGFGQDDWSDEAGCGDDGDDGYNGYDGVDW